MKNFLILAICLLAIAIQPHAQVIMQANSSSGGAYTNIRNQGFRIEGPDNRSESDCTGSGPGDHSSFGDHITRASDGTLNRNVFVFHSHIDEDSDRCKVFDRVRIEVKGSTASDVDDELKHTQNSTSYYRFQFRIPSNFRGSNAFCHLFQNKAQGGSDSGPPIITLTARDDDFEVIHHPGGSGSYTVIKDEPMSRFKGKWVEVYMRQKHSNGSSGQFEVQIKDMSNGNVILQHTDNSIDMWRSGATINRPKFGIYRSNTPSNLKDETVRFATFCSSESNSGQCPSLISSGSGSGSGSLSGTFRLRNRQYNDYLDTDGSGQVRAKNGNGNSDQKWRFVLASGSNQYNIDNIQSGRGVLLAENISNNSLNNLSWSSNQPTLTWGRAKWIPEQVSGNIYRFRNSATNKYLAQVSGGGSGTEYASTTGNRAQWVLESTSSKAAPTGNLSPANDALQTSTIVSVYPLLVGPDFEISVSKEQKVVASLFDLSGKLIREVTFVGMDYTFNRPPSTSSGMYILTLRMEDGQLSTHKMMFQ